MMRERSAGFIVFHRNNDNDFKLLLLLNSKGHWDFPKGHVEEGEEIIEAAKRELKEEAGIEDITIYPLFNEKISYYYVWGSERRFKEVFFFLGETKTKNVVISYEHKDYKWVKCDDALKMISFDNSRSVLKKACEYIRKNILMGRPGFEPGTSTV